MPHRTEIAGFMTFLHGDARFYNNIFIQRPIRPVMQLISDSMAQNGGWDEGNIEVGTFRYNGYPTFAQWDKEFEGYCGMGSEPSDRYYMHLPVWTGGNVFLGGAKPWEQESDYVEDPSLPVSVAVEERGDGWYLATNLYELLPAKQLPLIDTEALGMAFEPEQRFENPDGSPIRFDEDFFGLRRENTGSAGPFVSGEAAQRKLF